MRFSPILKKDFLLTLSWVLPWIPWFPQSFHQSPGMTFDLHLNGIHHFFLAPKIFLCLKGAPSPRWRRESIRSGGMAPSPIRSALAGLPKLGYDLAKFYDLKFSARRRRNGYTGLGTPTWGKAWQCFVHPERTNYRLEYHPERRRNIDSWWYLCFSEFSTPKTTTWTTEKRAGFIRRSKRHKSEPLLIIKLASLPSFLLFWSWSIASEAATNLWCCGCSPIPESFTAKRNSAELQLQIGMHWLWLLKRKRWH